MVNDSVFSPPLKVKTVTVASWTAIRILGFGRFQVEGHREFFDSEKETRSDCFVFGVETYFMRSSP